MAWRQLIAPNTSVVGTPGWCLMFARQMFNRPAIEPTAWNGWERAQYKHGNKNFPSGVAVPVWFDYWESGTRYGHVAIRMANGTVWSSPYQVNSPRAILGSVEECERIYGVRYAGWSEDISGARVAIYEQEDKNVKILDTDNYYRRYSKSMDQIRGRDVSGKGFSRDEFRKSFVTNDDLTMLERMSDDPEADRAHGWMKLGYLADKDKWSQQIYDLQKALANANQALANALAGGANNTKELEKARKELTEVVEKYNKIKTQQEIDAEAGASILRRIGQLFTNVLGGGK